MLSERITSLLNVGDCVAAEVPSDRPRTRCFVRIRPIPKPGIAREERRCFTTSSVAVAPFGGS
jgi:hypothetical protein